VGESYLSPCYNPPIPHSFPLESEAFCVMCDRNFIYNDEYVISEMIGGTVLEGFELSGWTGLALTVEGYDPLKGTVTIKNNKLSSGTYVIVGFIFGTYNESTGQFQIVGYTKDSTTYCWGSYEPSVSVPSRGGTKNVNVETYALNPSSEITLDILPFVGPYNVDGTAVLRYDSVDWGYGKRVIGINWDDLRGYLSHIYDTKIYTDQVTVSPYALPAEVRNFSIAKA